MRRKQRPIHIKEHKLRCPACLKAIDNTSNIRAFGPEKALLPKPGDLTECSHCKQMLEYQEESILHHAPQKRVDEFNELMKSTPCEPRLSELIEFARKYRQMPLRPPIGYRFRTTRAGQLKIPAPAPHC